jgi:hypothetical protein
MAPRCSKQELLDHALQLIKPPTEKIGACRLTIDTALKLVEMVRPADEASAPGALKKELEPFVGSLKKTKIAISKFHATTRHLVFRGVPEIIAQIDQIRFIDDLDRLIATCEFMIDHIKVRRGSKPWSAVKDTCCLQASILLKEFSNLRPTQCKDGPFLQLAAILFQISGGEEGADLSDYCENLDRVVPPYVAEISHVPGSTLRDT